MSRCSAYIKKFFNFYPKVDKAIKHIDFSVFFGGAYARAEQNKQPLTH